MYIAQQSFTSVHGRYYFRGQEISWLRYQLLAQTDKIRFVRRNLYVSTYEEDYRQELQERDGESGILTLDTIGELRGVPEAIFNTQPPIGEEWTPAEDFGSVHYRGVHPEPIQDLGGERFSMGAEDIDSTNVGQNPVYDTPPQPYIDPGPPADWNNDLPQNQQDSTSNNDLYDTPSTDSVDSSSTSSDTSSDSSSDSSSGGD